MANNKDFKVKNSIQPTVYHEGLGTVTSGVEEYSLANASYDSVSFSVASQATGLVSVQFKSDGTKMYVATQQTSSAVYQYSLSTAWDVSTASYDSVSFDPTSQLPGAQVSSLFFSSDGTAMYAGGSTADAIYQYTLSTAWDLSTASYASKSLSVSSVENNPKNIFFKSDGTKLFLVGTNGDNVYQYSLTTAWDISTASYDSVNFSVSTQDATPVGLWFSSSGQTMFVYGDQNDTVFQYTLSTAWDVSSASYDSISFSTSSEETTSRGLAFSADGTKMYAVGISNNTIYQYSTTLTTNTLDLSTGSVFEITPTSGIQVVLSNPADSGVVDSATLIMHGNIVSSYNISSASFRSMFEVSGQESAVQGVTFKPDGTKMYLIGSGGDEVNEYSLSSPWEVTSATFVQNFSVSSQEVTPRHVFFRADGLKMYVTGTSGDDVNEYNLTTAWDISTASYSQLFSVSSQDTAPRTVWFKPDGLKMYILGGATDTIYQYTLSTAWDVTTASYDSVSFSTSSQATTPEGMYITSDGTKIYLINQSSTDTVFEYEFSTAWDVSTLSYTGVSFSDIPQVGSTNNTTQGVTLSEDGTKMYIVENSEKVIMQFDIGGTATVYYDNSISFSGDTPPVSPNDGDTDIVTFFTKDGGTTYKALQVMNGAS